MQEERYTEYEDADRQEAIRLAIVNFDGESEVHRRFDPGTFGSHEAADRTFLLAENIESYLLNHPTLAMNKEAYHKTYLAHQLLLDVYQIVAVADFPNEKVE